MTDIGATLREARMRARIDINEVEQATKIRAKYLRAMEDEEWGVLPGSTYVKGFLRTYGDYLGLDSRMLVEEYKRRYERPSESEIPPLVPPRGGGDRRPRDFGRWVPFVVGVLVLAGVLAGLYLLGRDTNDGGKSSAGTPATATTAPKRAAKKKSAKKPQKPPAATPRRVRLKLQPTGAVYVCLVDGAGHKLISGITLQPGATTRTFTARLFRINLGNDQVRVRVNGKLLPVPASGGGIGFELKPGRRRALPVGQRPTCA
jgi:cytoskeleton protein RodZ